MIHFIHILVYFLLKMKVIVNLLKSKLWLRSFNKESMHIISVHAHLETVISQSHVIEAKTFGECMWYGDRVDNQSPLLVLSLQNPSSLCWSQSSRQCNQLLSHLLLAKHVAASTYVLTYVTASVFQYSYL